MSRIVFVLSLLLLPSVALAAPRTYEELANLVLRYINILTGLAIALGFVIYLFGMATNMTRIGQDGWSKFKVHVMWGIAAMFVMVSVYGIVTLVRNTLFNGSTANTSGTRGIQCQNMSDCFFGNE